MSKDKKPSDEPGKDEAAKAEADAKAKADAEAAAAAVDAELEVEAAAVPEKPPIAWTVSLDGNPELRVPTEKQAAAGKAVPRSGPEAWELYAEAMGITSTQHPYSASPVYA